MILVTGARGQLGTDVDFELTRRGIMHLALDIDELDITDSKNVNSVFKVSRPTCVIHCAAYTAVEAAEDDVNTCMRVNADGTKNLAMACQEMGTEMIYLSTDYVFYDSSDEPLEIDSEKSPISAYGRSKLAGEEYVQKYVDKHYIVRISWLFGIKGGNFVKTMLKLAQEKNEVSVVNDQIGSPTYTVDIAVLLCDMALSGKYGVYHATNEGFCSWAEFADEIMKLNGGQCKVNHIPSELYPTKVLRPKNSRLSKASLDKGGFSRLPDWKDALKRFIENLQSANC